MVLEVFGHTSFIGPLQAEIFRGASDNLAWTVVRDIRGAHRRGSVSDAMCSPTIFSASTWSFAAAAYEIAAKANSSRFLVPDPCMCQLASRSMFFANRAAPLELLREVDAQPLVHAGEHRGEGRYRGFVEVPARAEMMSIDARL
ncbi:hypothetical protein [Nonomuraea jabiensis]|uniref:Uncharacterized protein n=1 Tax=Nonomuraea jabiensis TaxID=882448 RepID=A0A7W9LGY8_9ACTN|nr:hypothetical protein [Nonomuraea jabiensis]MBB5783358.1 hypothetical protein [Nonomuraea jabiensis]